MSVADKRNRSGSYLHVREGLPGIITREEGIWFTLIAGGNLLSNLEAFLKGNLEVQCNHPQTLQFCFVF